MEGCRNITHRCWHQMCKMVECCVWCLFFRILGRNGVFLILGVSFVLSIYIFSYNRTTLSITVYNCYNAVVCYDVRKASLRLAIILSFWQLFETLSFFFWLFLFYCLHVDFRIAFFLIQLIFLWKSICEVLMVIVLLHVSHWTFLTTVFLFEIFY